MAPTPSKPEEIHRLQSHVAQLQAEMGQCLNALNAALQERLRHGDDREGQPRDPGAPLFSERISFKVGRDHVFVDAADILWVEAHGNSVRIGTGAQVHLVRQSLQSVETRLDPRRFLRVHRSFLVNVDRINRIKSELYGDHLVLMSDGARIPLSRSHRSALKFLLNGAAAPSPQPLSAI